MLAQLSMRSISPPGFYPQHRAVERTTIPAGAGVAASNPWKATTIGENVDCCLSGDPVAWLLALYGRADCSSSWTRSG